MMVTTNDLIIRALRGERTERTPVWLMRQAGRFDPAYLALRERCGLPLETLFRTPVLAAEITLLPKRFGVDALILFQDILTPVAPMGAPFVFRPGPTLAAPIRSADDVAGLRELDPVADLPFVVESIELVRRELAGAMPLLGFAGAPFTLAAFMIEGRSPGELPATRAMMRDAPDVLHELLDRLARMTIDYLRLQIDAGVDAVQLFESLADSLDADAYRVFARPYQERVLTALAGAVPRILFAKGLVSLEPMLETGADVLSVGTGIDLAAARARLGDGVGLQGNVDNRLLADGTPDEVTNAAEACIRAGGHRGHVLNLSHGLLPRTPVDNVRRLIDACHALRLDRDAEQDRGDQPW
jgi:uroporphyrinogen decarboxylase